MNSNRFFFESKKLCTPMKILKSNVINIDRAKYLYTISDPPIRVSRTITLPMRFLESDITLILTDKNNNNSSGGRSRSVKMLTGQIMGLSV